MTVDYRHLLAKYADHVEQMEGIDFIGPPWDEHSWCSNDEWDALHSIQEMRGVVYPPKPKPPTARCWQERCQHPIYGYHESNLQVDCLQCGKMLVSPHGIDFDDGR